MARRFRFGPQFGYDLTPAPVAAPPGVDPIPRADVDVELASVDTATRTVVVRVPAYDAATHIPLDEVRVYLFDPATPPGETAQEFYESAAPHAASDVASLRDGADVALVLPPVAPGVYVGKVVLVDDGGI